MTRPSTGTHIKSACIDYLLALLVIYITCIPTMFHLFSPDDVGNYAQLGIFPLGGPLHYVSLAGFALFCCKDSFNGRSPGKRVMGLQVVDNGTLESASPMQCLVRNVTVIIWPIEMAFVLLRPGRRIGDWLAGTRVAAYNASQEHMRPGFWRVFIPLAIAYGAILLLFSPLRQLNPKIVKESYNAAASKQLQGLLNDSLGRFISAQVQVYDSVSGRNLKGVTVLCHVKKKYMKDKDSTLYIQRAAEQLIYRAIPPQQFMGWVAWIAPGAGTMQVKTKFIGTPLYATE